MDDQKWMRSWRTQLQRLWVHHWKTNGNLGTKHHGENLSRSVRVIMLMTHNQSENMWVWIWPLIFTHTFIQKVISIYIMNYYSLNIYSTIFTTSHTLCHHNTWKNWLIFSNVSSHNIRLQNQFVLSRKFIMKNICTVCVFNIKYIFTMHYIL